MGVCEGMRVYLSFNKQFAKAVSNNFCQQRKKCQSSSNINNDLSRYFVYFNNYFHINLSSVWLISMSVNCSCSQRSFPG